MRLIDQFLCSSLIAALFIGSCSAPDTPPATQLSPTKTAAATAFTSESAPIAASATSPAEQPAYILFDDFNYSSHDEMASNGWIIRAWDGWPGVPGATFRAENVFFLDDTQTPNNRFVRMTSSTDGTGGNTFQTQICHQRKYLEGTYAAHVYFNDGPVSGPDGDQVVETFYTITPYEEEFNAEYSEMDFEYLPNGGWGLPETAFAFTTWETVSIEPWQADNASNSLVHSMAGWRTLVVQVKDGIVRYYVGGILTAEHSGNYYPDSPMSINFNLWFINDGLFKSHETRVYEEDIDWVFHEGGVILTPEEVDEKVLAMRESGIHFVDTVPPASPVLDSLCDL